MANIYKVSVSKPTPSRKKTRFIYYYDDGTRKFETVPYPYDVAVKTAQRMNDKIALDAFNPDIDGPLCLRKQTPVEVLKLLHLKHRKQIIGVGRGHISKNTYESDEVFWKIWDRHVGLTMNVEHVKPGTVKRFVDSLRKSRTKINTSYQPRSINKYLAHGSGAWEFARKIRLRKENPFKEFGRLPEPSSVENINIYYPDQLDDLESYFKATSPPHQLYAMLFALDTGCRTSGLISCTLNDAYTDIVEGKSRYFLRFTEKGNKTRSVPATKRVIQILDELKALVEAPYSYIDQWMPRQFGLIDTYAERIMAGHPFWMLTRTDGVRRFWSRSLSAINKTRLQEKKPIIRGTFNDLRHTFGTRLGESDVGLVPIKALMGHSLGNDVTTKHYLKVTNRMLVRAIDKMQAYYTVEETTTQGQ